MQRPGSSEGRISGLSRDEQFVLQIHPELEDRLASIKYDRIDNYPVPDNVYLVFMKDP
jgi:hypothetical protein